MEEVKDEDEKEETQTRTIWEARGEEKTESIRDL